MVLNTSDCLLFVDGAMVSLASTDPHRERSHPKVGGVEPGEPITSDEAIERVAENQFGPDWLTARSDHEALEETRDDIVGDDPRTRHFFVIKRTWTLGPDGKRLDPWIDPYREAQHRAEVSFIRRALAAEPRYLDMRHGAIGGLKSLLAKGSVAAFLRSEHGQWWPIPRTFWRKPEARDALDKGYLPKDHPIVDRPTDTAATTDLPKSEPERSHDAATIGAETTSPASVSGPPVNAPVAGADRYRTGKPGKPSGVPLVLEEFDRRRVAGEIKGTPKAVAHDLADWYATTIRAKDRDAPSLAPGTIKNVIRKERGWPPRASDA